MIAKYCLASALFCAAAFSSANASEIKLEGTCELHYKGEKVAEGQCTATQIKTVVSVKAVVEENGARYQAIIDNDKNSGVIIGCGAFTLADGELSKNEATRFAFPNGYELRMNL